MFVLEKARRAVDTGKSERVASGEYYYVVCLNHSVEYPISRWAKMLPLVGANKPHVYISVAIRFFNFLLKRNKRYYEASPKDIRDFFERILFFDKEGSYGESPRIQPNTISLYQKALIHFYKNLNDFFDNNIWKGVDVNVSGKTVEVIDEFKTRWEDVYSEAQACIKYSIGNHKTNNKVYVKEYSDDELAAIFRSFKTSMHRAVFFLTLKGMRIDEILSIKINDYDPNKMIVQPSRSKGRKGKKSDIRTILIGPKGVRLIQQYLLHERIPALNVILKEKRNDNEYLFVTLRKRAGVIPFTPYTQESFRSVLKTAARLAGIKSDVRPHGGRAHCSIELARLQHRGVITDVQINLIMGWKSPDSYKPYNEHVYKEEAEKVLANVHMDRNERQVIARLDVLLEKEEKE